MSIQDTFQFDKSGEVVERPFLKRFFLIFIIILVALLAFGIGQLSGQSRGGVDIKYDPSITQSDSHAAVSESSTQPSTQQIFASSKGTKYYYTGCSNNISAANKIFFASAAFAEQAGYTPASGCQPK